MSFLSLSYHIFQLGFRTMPSLRRTYTSMTSMLFRKETGDTTYISAEAPKLHLDDLFSPTMALNGYNHLLADPSAPQEQNVIPSTDGNPRPSSTEPAVILRDHQTPTRQRPRSDSRLLSPPLPEADLSLNSPPTLSGFNTPSSEISSLPWSAAVGRATTGKSGRVIEKLMGDNDRLQRETNLSRVRLEEESKRSDSARSALESFRISNANLLSIHETDKTFLAKKDRRIEELRQELEHERSKRQHAERETMESRSEHVELVEKLSREAAEDKQQAQRSDCQYEALSGSWKSLEEGYEKQLSKLKDDLKGLKMEIEDDKGKLTHLEVILEQLILEGDRSRNAKEKLSSEFEEYKAEQQLGIQGLRERAETNSAAHDQSLDELKGVLGEMKWIVNVGKDVHRDVHEAQQEH